MSDWNYEYQKKPSVSTTPISKLQNCECHTPTLPVNLWSGRGNEEQLQSMQLIQQDPQA